MKTAVLLLAYGTPDRVEDVPRYLEAVFAGRAAGPEVVREVEKRYRAIGGSPLKAITFQQARALEKELGLPVYVGMRTWHPFISETVAQLQQDGVERIVALCLAPQYSRYSVQLYFNALERALEQLCYRPSIIWVRDYHDHPLLIQAFAEKLQAVLPAQQVLFTAHSLPASVLKDGDPYPTQVKATAEAVARQCQLPAWDFAFQSQGLAQIEWLGPTVESQLEAYAREGIRDVILQPIGFVADHLEILYDIDIQFRQYAAQLGIALRRPESLNDSATFIACLAEVVRQQLEATS